MHRMLGAAALLVMMACGAQASDNNYWKGAYLGGHVGGGWGPHDADIDVGGLVGVAIPLDQRGVVAGLHAGFNHLSGPWLAGLEATFALSTLDGATAVSADAFVPGMVVHTNSDTRWLASVVGRVGYTRGPLLVFAKGGLAVADIEFRGYSEVGGMVLGGATAGGLRTGWATGVGLEYAVSRAWSVRVDYDRTDFGSKSYEVGAPTVITLEPDVHTVRAGLSYRLGAR